MSQWVRVTRAEPCPVCKHPDWCGLSQDRTAACCMRVQDGSHGHAKNGGWIHRLAPGRPLGRVGPPKRPPSRPPPGIDAEGLWRRWRAETPADAIAVEADRLGVSWQAWEVMGAVLTERADVWALPMFSGDGKACGIRLRSTDGQKWAVRGSRAGVFLPALGSPQVAAAAGVAAVVEGPTDAAACLDLGLYPIGRPSCLGCEEAVIRTARRLGLSRLTVVADNDGPGITGARKLCDVLTAARLGWRLVTAGGHKDMRQWRRAGATAEAVTLTWAMAQWR